MTKEIKIPYSNLKIGLVFTGALTFVVLSIMILMDKEGLTSIMFRSEMLNKVVAVIAILFFGTVCVTIPWKLFQNNMGLIINDKGIIDKSNLSSIGLIEWEDITGIRTEKVEKTRFFLIDTNKPKKYLDKANSKFKKQLLSGNNRMYKTPLSITLTILKVKFNDLEKLLIDAFEENKKS
jgi:hypothetical protein